MENKWINKIRDFFKNLNLKDDRRVVIFLVCVGIATSFWFLNALSKDYKVELSFPVRYTNLPENKNLTNEPPANFILEVNAHGFSILRHKLSLAFSPLVFNVNQFTGKMMEESTRSSFAISSRRFIGPISDQISNELQISHIWPDTLHFKFDQIIEAKVKVLPNLKIDFKKQYYQNGEIRTRPDSVLVSGPKSVLDTLKYVQTKFQNYNEIDQTIQRNISLEESEIFNCQPKRVVLNIPVEEFTEKQLEIPITVYGLPENMKINLFPAKTRLTFMTGLSIFNEITINDFEASVSYRDILKNQDRLIVNITRQPVNIQALNISTTEVEYLIEK